MKYCKIKILSTFFTILAFVLLVFTISTKKIQAASCTKDMGICCCVTGDSDCMVDCDLYGYPGDCFNNPPTCYVDCSGGNVQGGSCSCSGDCSYPYCGGDDGCGGTCSNSSYAWTDTGATDCPDTCGWQDVQKEQSNPCVANNKWVDSGSDCCNVCWTDTNNTRCDNSCGTHIIEKEQDNECNNDTKWVETGGYCCNRCSPACVTLNTPTNGATFSNVPNVLLDWSATSNWGNSCPDEKKYQLCVGSAVDGSGNTTNCNYVNQTINEGSNDYTNTSYNFNNGGGASQLAAGTYYWDVTTVNRDQSCTTNSQMFEVSQPEKECTVTINDSTNWSSWSIASPTIDVTLQGNAHATDGDTVRLWVERVDGGRLNPNNISPAATELGAYPYYYNIETANCNSALTTCTTTDTTVQLPTMGNYYFHCDVRNNPQRCSGNPFCSYEDSTVYGQSKPSPYPAAACTNWQSCHDATNDSPTSSDNVFYCAGAGEPTINITKPANTQINMTNNPVDFLDIEWENLNLKANQYTFTLKNFDVDGNENETLVSQTFDAPYPWGNTWPRDWDGGGASWDHKGPTAAFENSAGDRIQVYNGRYKWDYDTANSAWLNDYRPADISTDSLYSSLTPHPDDPDQNYPWTNGGPTAAWEDSYNNSTITICNGQYCWQWDNNKTGGAGWIDFDTNTSGIQPLDISTSDASTTPEWTALDPATDGTNLWDSGPTSAWENSQGQIIQICNQSWCWQWNQDPDGDPNTDDAYWVNTTGGAIDSSNPDWQNLYAPDGTYPWSDRGLTAAYENSAANIITVCNGKWCWLFNTTTGAWINLEGNDISQNSYWEMLLPAETMSYRLDLSDLADDEPADNPNREYSVEIIATNDTCTPYLNPESATDSRTFQIVADITGAIISDPDNTAAPFDPVCLDADSSPIKPLRDYFSNISLSVFNDPELINEVTINTNSSSNGVIYNDGVNGGTYTITVPYHSGIENANYYLRLDATNREDRSQAEWYTCSTCSSDPNLQQGEGALGYRQFSCQYGGISSPMTDANFYLSSRNLAQNPWWQATGGNIFAKNEIVSLIPNTACENDPNASGKCQPYIVRNDINLTSGFNNEAGIPLTSASTIDSTSDADIDDSWSTQYGTSAGLNVTGNGVHDLVPIYRSFEYFAGKVDLSDATIINQDTWSTKPALSGSGQTNIYYHSGNLTFSPSTTWTVASGEKMIIFIDEDATGNANLLVDDANNLEQLLEIETGGFVAFIVKGSIVFEPTVGTEIGYDAEGHTIVHQETPNITGIFLADKNIIVADDGADSYSPDNNLDSRDKKFTGAGSFVGWQDVKIHRSFEDTNIGRELHQWSPVASFKYRPDLVISFPIEISVAQYEWREVEPQILN